jgi:hypothetical protein
MVFDGRRIRAFGLEPERASGFHRSGSTTVPRAVHPASNPLAASVRGRHLISARDMARLRDGVRTLAWMTAGAAAFAGWLALVFAVGA